VRSQNRKRILYVHHGAEIGGAPLSLLFLIEKIDRTRYEPIVVFLQQGSVVDLFREHGIEVHVNQKIKDYSHTTGVWYGLDRPPRFFHKIIRFWPSVGHALKTYEQLKPDLIHLNSATLGACAIAAKKAGIPLVWHVREILVNGYIGIRKKFYQRLIGDLSERIIAICQYGADVIERPEKTTVIYNFVNLEEFDHDISSQIVRQDLNLDANTKCVGMLGGVSQIKGTLEFVQALPLVKQRHQNVKFLVIGAISEDDKPTQGWRGKARHLARQVLHRDEYYKTIIDFIQREGIQDDVIFTGLRQDIPQIIAALDLVAFPSTVSHFGRPIIEAGAMAKPVIASDLGGPRELVVNGETGFLIPAGDPAKLAEAIVTVLSNGDLARRMGEAGHARAKRLYNAEFNAKRTFQVYEDILGRVIAPWEAKQRKYAEFELPYRSSQKNVGVNEEGLKDQIKEYWNKEICGTGVASSKKYSRQYFDEIEDSRYTKEPEVFPFAQFTRFRGQKVLEVGVGAGTDFIQWVRAGAKAYGIDLAEESVEHVRNRLRVYGLSAEEVRVADAENLPYPDNTFDLVYSWGVIHHTPDTIKALKEIIRVTRIGGIIKIMVYNRRSLNAFRTYLRFGLLKGRLFKSISWVLYRNMESIGTKAFTIREIENILADYPVHIRNISARVTNYDLLWNKSPLLRFISYVLACSLGFQKTGWFMIIELQKTGKLEMSK
jgi:glycosyltransferase involved in cell wall biosynthesis/ubiquinone/menaquinone biosynthesis C-methylase UbiE